MLKYASLTLSRGYNTEKGRRGRNVRIGDWNTHAFNETGLFRGGSQLILGYPGAVSRADKMSVVKVSCKIETSPWAITLTEPVPEAFELPASDRTEKKIFQANQQRSSRVTLMFPYTTQIFSSIAVVA